MKKFFRVESYQEALLKGLYLCVILVIAGIASAKVHSFDIFWQLQSGKYLLATKTPIYTDIFTLASDAPRHEHCWLHDIVFYLVYLVGGYEGISLFKGSIVAGTLLTVVAIARNRGSSWFSIFAVTFMLFLWSRGGWLERPQLWTFLFFAVFLYILDRHVRVRDRRCLLLFPLMIVWSNLHAGAVLAFPVVGAYLLAALLSYAFRRSQEERRALKWLALTFALLFIGALMTPYGKQLLETLMGAANLGVSTSPSGEVSGPVTAVYNADWQLTTFALAPHFYIAMAIAGCSLLLGWRRLAWADLFVLGGMVLMGLKLHRHTPFLPIAAAALLPIYIDTAIRPIRSFFSRFRLASVLSWVLIALLAYNLALFGRTALREYGFFDVGLREWHYPVKAAEFVRENSLPENLFNTYEWGGYLAWSLFPEYRVFWDGRQDSRTHFQSGVEVVYAKPEWKTTLDAYDINTLVLMACHVDTGQRYAILDLLESSSDWALVFADQSALVFVRRGAVEAEWLQGHELPTSRIKDTILQQSKLAVATDPWKHAAWWEMARIYLERNDYDAAFDALENHVNRAPKPNPVALRFYRRLYPMMQAGK